MLGPIDGAIRQLSYHSFYGNNPTVLGVTRAAASAFGFLTVTTFFVAIAGKISLSVPVVLVLVFTYVSLIHIIQLKVYRKLYT